MYERTRPVLPLDLLVLLGSILSTRRNYQIIMWFTLDLNILTKFSDLFLVPAQPRGTPPVSPMAYILAVASLALRIHSTRRDFLCRGVLPTGIASGIAWPPAPAVAVGLKPAAESFSWVAVPGPFPTDRRAYALVTLANGVQGLVCTDDTYTRCEMAVTVNCGSLDDPAQFEGLAHLTEHVTLASDPAELGEFIEALQGDVNAFTGERTTSFYAQFDLGRVVSGLPLRTAPSAAMAAGAADVAKGIDKFAALFRTRAASTVSVIRQEARRVDDELRAISLSPPRALIQVASLKARASDQSVWRRLGRGGATTLKLMIPMEPAEPSMSPDCLPEGHR